MASSEPNPDTTTSMTLIRGVLDGDPESEEKFVQIYQKVIQKLILSKSNWRTQPSDIDDLSQDVFIRLFRFLGSFVREPPFFLFRKWLATVVQNTILDAGMKRKYAAQSFGGESVNVFNEIEESVAEITETTLREPSFRQHVANAMKKVEMETNPVHWQVFLRSTIDDRPSADVALELNLTTTNVRKINQRVKEAIVSELCEPN